MKIFRVAKILGQNFIFGPKKIGLGSGGVPLRILLEMATPVVSMQNALSVYVLNFYHLKRVESKNRQKHAVFNQ